MCLDSDLDEIKQLRTQLAKIYSIFWFKKEIHIDSIGTAVVADMQAVGRVLKTLGRYYIK